MSWRPSTHSSSTAPELRVVLRLEEDAQAYLVADSFEDERRLRVWLGRTDALARLVALLEELLEEERST